MGPRMAADEAAPQRQETGHIPAPSELDKAIQALLRQHADRKLLDLRTGAQIYGFLLLHPSPRDAIKSIARQRPAEDLMMIQSTIGIAGRWIRAEFPDTDEQVLVNKAVALEDLMKSESPAYRNYGQLYRLKRPPIAKASKRHRRC